MKMEIVGHSTKAERYFDEMRIGKPFPQKEDIFDQIGVSFKKISPTFKQTQKNGRLVYLPGSHESISLSSWYQTLYSFPYNTLQNFSL